MNKIRAIAQVVGFVTLGLLALYGALTFLGGAGPFGLAVQADDNAPAAPAEPAATLGGTIPQTMNYQGFVRNPDGSLTTGAYTITARIYELAAPAAGETIFYETEVRNVTVRDGLFNIVLGDDPALPPEAFSDAPRYIGIDLNDGAGELIPRQRLHAVPWAMTANTLADDAPAQSVQGLSSSGDIEVDGDVDVGGKLRADGLGLIFQWDIVSSDCTREDHRCWCDLPTGISVSEYNCAVAGFYAHHGDINEYDEFNFGAKMEIDGDEWHAVFRASCDELWDSVQWSYLCIPKSLFE